MLAQYLDFSQVNTGSDCEASTLMLSLLGQMPVEFFSESSNLVHHDVEGINCARHLADNFGIQKMRDFLKLYLDDIFQVKASLSALPRFQGSKDSQSKITHGLIRLLLLLDSYLREDQTQWFKDVMGPSLDILHGQILTSSYLSPEIIDQKITTFTLIFSNLAKYSTT